MEPIAPTFIPLGTIPAPILAMGLWVILGLVVLVGAITTLILVYHWMRYGRTLLMFSTGGLIYLIGAGILLSSAVLSLSAYTSSL